MNANECIWTGHCVKVAFLFILEEGVREPELISICECQVANSAVVIVVGETVIVPHISVSDLCCPGIFLLVDALYISNEHVHGDHYRLGFIILIGLIDASWANLLVVVRLREEFSQNGLLCGTDRLLSCRPC